MSEIQGPDNSHRTSIVGRTGSGKTRFGTDLLSSRDWTERPWIIVDYKRETFLGKVRRAVGRNVAFEMKPTDKVPKKPGLYFVYANPGTDDEAMDELMHRIWERGDTGFMIDEGFMLPQRMPKWNGYTYLLTQGRSLGIPMIMLYQKPVWMNTFALSQTDFFAVFRLNNDTDEDKIMEYVEPAIVNGKKITPNSGLPEFHCLWYEVGKGRSSVLRPARSEAAILATFSERAASMRQGAFS